MKRVLLLCLATLAFACNSFIGSDTNGGGGGGGGDDGGGADGGGGESLIDGSVTGGKKDGSPGSDGDGGGEAGAADAGGGDSGPAAFCDGLSLLCQDFATAASATDGWVNGVATPNVVTVPTSGSGSASFSAAGMVWQARVMSTSGSAYLVSAGSLGQGTFTLTLRFAIQVNTDVQFLRLLMDTNGNASGVNFKATATQITATSTLGTMPTATLVTNTQPVPYLTLTIKYNGTSFALSTDTGASATLMHINSTITQVSIGAQGTGAIDYVFGYRLTSP